MSLINKMLQDLDARQTAGREATDLYTKPVARREARPSLPLLAVVSASVVALAVAGALGWRYLQKTREHANTPKPVPVVRMPAVPPPAVQAPPVLAALPPQAATPPAQAAAPAEHAEPPAAAADKPVPPANDKAGPDGADRQSAQAPMHGAAASSGDEEPVARKPRAERKARDSARPAAAAKTTTQKAPAQKPSARTGSAAGARGESAPGGGQGKAETATQRAETAYRRALAAVQEGYVNEAITTLEQALQANPRHDAARQTLVSLLIEARRGDEAMRQLQLGLTLDPGQPAMAMLLARLQIERGGSGIETLMRTLPYVGGNGEYRAFLAGALQRQRRHREAAEQYQAALRSAPQNGVWWMGLGISLQAEKRDADALDAFRKAKASATLSPELLAFVENKIQQLSR